MPKDRVILHADMDAFYAAVEQRERPELKGRPVIVGGLGNRGVVSAASYEAREYGVHSAMPVSTARRLCPGGVYLPPQMALYAEASGQVFSIFREFSPLVEPLSLDEAFIDVTGSRALFGDGPTIAQEIRGRVLAATKLVVSVGVASSKYVAKVASDLDKPDGLVVVPPGEEKSFLAPLAIKRLWGAGKVTQKRLAAAGLKTIGDIQARSVEDLMRIVGESAGAQFHRLAVGDDHRAVQPGRDAKSISHEITFSIDLIEDDACREVLLQLSDNVGRRLRSAGLAGRVVKLKLRYRDFTTVSRQRRLPRAIDDDPTIYDVARQLFEESRENGRPVRLLGVGVFDFAEEGAVEQLDLFNEPDPRTNRLMNTMDRIRDRFGSRSIGRGTRRPH